MGSFGGSDGKEFACNAVDLGSILGSGRSPGEGNGYLLQDSCLENRLDRGALAGYCSQGHDESDMTYQLNNSRKEKKEALNPQTYRQEANKETMQLLLLLSCSSRV